MKVASRVLWDTSVFSLEYRHPLHLYAMWIGTSTEMSLELSKETIKGFALWDDDEVFPSDDAFKAFIEAAFQEALGSASDLKTKGTIKLKQALSTALSAIFEAAKQDSDIKQDLVPFFDEQGVSESRAKAFCIHFEKNRAALRNILSRTSLNIASVLSLDWRIDYLIKSDMLEQQRIPIYYLTIKTKQADGSLKDVQFTCNLQELQDLSAKIKDAKNAVENRVKAQ